jgi:hypothetical protein
MKSLVKSANSEQKVVGSDPTPTAVIRFPEEEAQCCAKVSKTVAGCHD